MFSGFELGEIAVLYVITMQSPIKILYNIIYHMPNIYDDIYDIVHLKENFPEQTLGYYQSVGLLAGDIINRIFFDPDDYYPYDYENET